MNNEITEANFLAWISNQPGTRKFDYRDIKGCLFAAFLSESCELDGVTCGGSGYLTPEISIQIPFPVWMLSLSSQVGRELNRVFSVSDVREKLKYV